MHRQNQVGHEVKRAKRLRPVGQLMNEIERESALQVAGAQTPPG